ncbi:MAG TPA: hypothetical protein DHW02_08305 [Ktedonobacter sp.]|nr:hypothetical protein [Ktedonobacter sp.]
MATQPDRLWMRVEDYLTLDRNSPDVRYEYIDGYAYLLAGGTANHSTIKLNITSVLKGLLRGGSCRVYDSDLKVRLSASRYAYPDAMVSCDSRDRGKIDVAHSPRIVFEVLSPSTEAYNRGEKFDYYRACPTIEEYVLVNAERQSIEVYRREAPFWVLSTFEAGDDVKLSSINVYMPVAAIYEDVLFSDDV